MPTPRDLFNGFIAIEEGSSLLKRATFCLDDIDIAEDELEQDPTAVDHLVKKISGVSYNKVNREEVLT